MPKYKVKSPLNHDNQDYKIGETIELTEKQAEPLLGHTLALPGEELTAKQVEQGVAAVENAARDLAEMREQLETEKAELRQAQDLFVRDVEKLNADREQLATDRAELDKAIKAAAKKS